MRAAPPRTHRSRRVSPPSSRTAPPPCGRGDSPRHSAPLRTARIPQPSNGPTRRWERPEVAVAVRGSGHGRDRERRRFPLRRWSRLARRRVTGAMRAAPRGRHRPAPLRAAPLRPTARSAAPVSGVGVGGGGDAGGGDAGPKDEGRWGGVAGNGRPRALRAPGGRSAGGWGGAVLLYSQ